MNPSVPPAARGAAAQPWQRPWPLLAAPLLLLCATAAGAPSAAAAPADPSAGRGLTPDIFLLAGWKVFHQNCHTCHGVDATGTDIAPNLVESIQRLTPRQFATKVLTRYRIVVGAGEAGADSRSALREAIIEEVRKHERGQAGELVMPAWEDSPEVQPHLLDIYDYLRARAAGTLGPGEPPSAPQRDPGDRISAVPLPAPPSHAALSPRAALPPDAALPPRAALPPQAAPAALD